jgi:murein DD-endopeptidase MepM/ murein hydrolase activator NlpD
MSLRDKSILLAVFFALLAFGVAGAEATSVTGQEADLHLIGIAVFQGRSTALIEDRTEGTQRFYEEGDALDGYVVKKIESNRVVLARDGAEFFLPLFALPEETLEDAPTKEEASPTDEAETKHARELKTTIKATARTKFLVPVSGEIASGFGYRQHPMGGERQFHRGIDIAAPYGRSVRATADGIVTFASRKWGLGKTVVIQHSDGWSSVYGHLSRILVSAGEKVEAGETIGNIGSTGISTGPHLHFELHKQGRAVNPATYLPLGK